MAILTTSQAATSSAAEQLPAQGAGMTIDAPELRLFVVALFFSVGGITSLNDVLMPKLKELFTLGYMRAMPVPSAFSVACFVISIPTSAGVKKLGYMRGAAVVSNPLSTARHRLDPRWRVPILKCVK